MKRKPVRAFIDQYGDVHYATTLKELRAKLGGRVSKMYVDSISMKKSLHIGYVLGKLWLKEYAPVER